MSEPDARADIESARRAAEDIEAGRTPPPKAYRNRTVSHDPAQVYSVRIPVRHLRQLRVAADAKGVTPSALVRTWVVERLEAESRQPTRLADARPYAVTGRMIVAGAASGTTVISWPGPSATSTNANESPDRQAIA